MAKLNYDELAAHLDNEGPELYGHQVLFEDANVVRLAQLRQDRPHLYEGLIAKWRGVNVPRLPALEGLVKRRLREHFAAARKQRDEIRKTIARVGVGHDPGEKAGWPRPLGYGPKVGDDSANAALFVAARPAPIVCSADVLYACGDSGVWAELPVAALRNEIRQTDPENRLGAAAVSAIVQSVKDKTFTAAQPFDWIEAPDGAPLPKDAVLFRNGLLDLRTEELLSLDGYFATGVPAFDYDPSAESPTWMAWLTERVSPSYIPTLQEWFGFMLVPDTSAQRFMSFIGKPRSGKGTAKTVLEALVGSAHSASVALGEIGSRFGLMGALDKRLLVSPDAKAPAASARNATLERLLSITGGDVVGIDRKNKPPINVKLVARLLILGNEPPPFLDESGALAARQLIVRFDRSFQGTEDQRIGDALLEELPGIANWALEGLHRLRQNNYQFTVGEEGRAAVKRQRLASSPALRFAQDALVVSGHSADFVLVDAVFDAYQEWVQREGLGRGQRRNKTDLVADLETALNGVRCSQPRGLTPPEGWTGRRPYRPRVLHGISGFTHVVDEWANL